MILFSNWTDSILFNGLEILGNAHHILSGKITTEHAVWVEKKTLLKPFTINMLNAIFITWH